MEFVLLDNCNVFDGSLINSNSDSRTRTIVSSHTEADLRLMGNTIIQSPPEVRDLRAVIKKINIFDLTVG